ncbi:PREDICTED: uncharacterized protein LOC109207408 [Nicotiana attenuata]|uniref:uncharacterized protein LOC109207408 n=1 Tax=Nicotiana attenuata TaxID=49451 RepID=UPI0009057C3C|nr:PREDICTED: uncharacterized protein LOC109207408 [Nicotiana attenuata]
MADEITERLNNIILTEEEKDAVAIEYPDIQSRSQNTMPLVWGHPVGLQIKEIGWNFFQFIFKDKESKDKVWFATPWLYDKYLLNVHPLEPGLKSAFHVFNICNLWVQVWNILLHWMSKDVGRKIGHALGGTVDIVIPENGSKERRYMRTKVTVNINRPLPRRKLIKLGLETNWVEIRYENLPYVCYYCGMLGHNDRTCVQIEKDIRSRNLKSDQFGTWLRAKNHLLASDNQCRQGVNTNNDGHTRVKNHYFELVEGKGVAGSSKSLLNLAEGTTSVEMQPDIRKEDLQGDQMQPMEATNYGSREKESAEVWNNTGVGTSDGIKTNSMRGLNIGLEKNDVQEQMPVDENMLNDIIELQQNLLQVASQMQDAGN